MADFGIYIHIPFCTKKCDYCAFATWAGRENDIARYIDALLSEISNAQYEPAGTVFIGGGTPSLLEPEDMARILGALCLQSECEVTVECNPETVSVSKLLGYRQAGVNRLSFGAQSFVPSVLESLGRWHNPDEIAVAVQAAREAGFESLNLDIIYGAFGESMDDWRVTVEKTIALEPEHISAYALTVEGGTPLFADKSRHPDDDDQASKYELVDDLLSAAGYVNYEISNWARPGAECKHNLLYWAQANYLGFGCAAHSHQAGRRFWNVSGIDRYLDRIENGETAVADEEVLSAEQREFESNELALRTLWGVNASAFEDDQLDLLQELFERDGEVVRLNQHGRLMANDVASRLRR